TGNWRLTIPYEIVPGFANCGRPFFQAYRYWLDKETLLSHELTFPPYLVVQTPHGGVRWTRAPEDGKEQLYHFLFFLPMTMVHVADNPIGKKTTLSTTDVAQMLTQLPRRAAFVRSGEEIGVI